MASTKSDATARHLFRHLLRASSYLPDKFARKYIYGHIKYRFRNTSGITPGRIRSAKSSLSLLQRAADGEVKPLMAVLNHAYGRAGRRRRQLIVTLQRAESSPPLPSAPAVDKRALEDDIQDENLAPSNLLPEETVDEERAQDERSAPSHLGVDEGGRQDASQEKAPTDVDTDRAILEKASGPGDYLDSRPMLKAILRSQAAHHPPDTDRPKIRHLQPQIPKENIWGRPIARKLQRNIQHKFCASTLNKLLPPLPEHEWIRLRDLATGAIRFTAPPPRRVQRILSTDVLLLSPAYLLTPIRSAARSQRDTVEMEKNQHRLTPRFMKRMWAAVWSKTPMMSYDVDTKVWTVLWGGGRSKASIGKVVSANRAELELFEGAEALGDAQIKPAARSRKCSRKSDETDSLRTPRDPRKNLGPASVVINGEVSRLLE